MIDLRFPTALQIMLFLAVADSSPVRGMTSAQLAKGMGVQSSFIRRFLAPLSASGLILATQGKAGGVRLARPSEQIGLQEIYRAIIGDKKIWQARSGGPQSCLVSSHTKPFFEHLANDARSRRPGSPRKAHPGRKRSRARIPRRCRDAQIRRAQVSATPFFQSRSMTARPFFTVAPGSLISALFYPPHQIAAI